jgi:glycosyl hydrolase family 106( putative alpha-L-rhamnosidase)
VPHAKLMPLATLQKLDELAQAGAAVVFPGGLPSGAPGLKGLDEKAAWNEVAAKLKSNPRVSDGDDLQALLAAAKVRCETWRKSEHLAFHRRAWSVGNVYFIKNESDQPYDGRIAPAVESKVAAIMDPADGQTGLADAAGGVRLQLAPHQAMFVKTFREPIEGAAWSYRETAGEATPLDGEWHVEFVIGGPELPPPLVTHRLASWTQLAGTEGERFAGTARYSIKFKPDAGAARYSLDLGTVADSARVELNGKPVATLISPPYQVEIGPLTAGSNQLAIEVTNVAANRIRDLDRRGVEWKIFKDINFVDLKYKPFDASNWPVRDAGLLGPVTLTPLESRNK